MMEKRRTIVLVLCCLLMVLLASSISGAYPNFDLNGETIRIQTRWGQTTPLGPEGIFDWYAPDGRLQAHIQEIEKLFNCKIEFVESGEWWRQDQGYLMAHLLGGDLPFHFFDIEIRDGFMYNQAIQGTLMPLNSIVEPEFYSGYPESFQVELTDPSYMFDGNIYGFESKNFVREPVGILWNIDLFEREGLPNLYELYENGEWTWQALADIARRATRDTNGDGEIDQVGLVADREKLFTTAIYSFGGTLNREVDGKQVFHVDDTAVEALEFVSDLLKEQVARVNWWWSRLRGGYAMGLWYVHDLIWLQEATPDDYGIVPVPKGPSATEHIADAWNIWMGAIPATVPSEQARGIIEVVKALWQLSEPHIEDLTNWEEEHWNTLMRYVPDRKSLENWQWLYQNNRYYRPAHVDQAIRLSGWRWPDFQNQVVNNNHSIQAYIAEWTPAIQGEMDTILNQ